MSAQTAAHPFITGKPANWVYKIGDVEFDGFVIGVLVDAKGYGCAKFIKDGKFFEWFQGGDKLLYQARRQIRAARGIPIHWQFAGKEAADLMRKIFVSEGIGIAAHFTPMV